MASSYGLQPSLFSDHHAMGAHKRKRSLEEEEEEHPLLRSLKRHRLHGSFSCPPHGPAYIGSQCLQCGRHVDTRRHCLVSLNYVLDGLAVDPGFLAEMKLVDLNVIRRTGKLLLVLDLDHTLLHSYPMQDFGMISGDPDRGIYEVENLETVTKIRPFAREFLRAASRMYDLHIYSAGERLYVEEMARLLDPQGEYFKDKVICRDDLTEDGKKGLDVLMGHPGTIVVLDDSLTAWKEKDRSNVIHMKGYFWNPREEIGLDNDRILCNILCLLERIHFDYFFVDGCGDVRDTLRCLKQEILHGYRFLFVDAHPPLPVNMKGKRRSWKGIVEEMGATACADEADGVTHVICNDVNGEDAKWAARNGKVVMGLECLRSAYYTWERPTGVGFA